MVRGILKILQHYCKIFKVCLTILRDHALNAENWWFTWKTVRTVNSYQWIDWDWLLEINFVRCNIVWTLRHHPPPLIYRVQIFEKWGRSRFSCKNLGSNLYRGWSVEGGNHSFSLSNVWILKQYALYSASLPCIKSSICNSFNSCWYQSDTRDCYYFESNLSRVLFIKVFCTKNCLVLLYSLLNKKQLFLMGLFLFLFGIPLERYH